MRHGESKIKESSMRSPVIAMHGSQDAEEGKVVVDTPHRLNHRRWSFYSMMVFVEFLGVPEAID